MNYTNLEGFTDVLGDEIANSQESQPLSLSSEDYQINNHIINNPESSTNLRSNEGHSIPRPSKGTGQYGQFRSLDEIDEKYRSVFSYPFFNLVQSSVIEDALYSDKSMVVCAPTGSGKTVVFEMAIVQLLMEIEDKHYTDDFKIIYMAPVKAVCTERLTEWYPKFTKLGLMCIVVTGDTDVDFSQLKPYRIIITTPEKWDMVTRRWREHRQLVEVIKLFLIDEVHILNDDTRGPVLEAVVSRMKTIESSAQSAHRIEQLQKQYQGTETTSKESPPKIRFVAVSATVSNPDDVAAWLGTAEKPAVYYKFGDESRPVKLKRIVEGYPCPEGTSIFKFDIILNYKLWPVIQKYHDGKPTLIFCNTRKSVALTAETLSRELTVTFSPEQKAKLTSLASTIKNKKLQALVLSGVGCHHAGLLFEERNNIEHAFRNRDLPILITTTTLAMGVNLPAHLVIIKNTQQYVNGAYQEYSISTVLQMVGRAGRPQYDTEATAVIMTRLCDKPRYQALVGGSEPLQSYLHKRLAENLNSEAALGTVNDVAQCVQWLRSTFLSVRAARDPKRYLGLPQTAPNQLISKKIEELCVKAMNGLATSGLITMDEASCIESTEAGRLMSIFYLDLETMKHIMKINGTETLERLLWVICESHELADMHLRVDERRCLNTLNRNNAAATIRFPMKGKISTRQMKLNCIIQAILGCLNIPEPSLNQEAMKIMRIADRVCKCLVAYITRPALITQQPKNYFAVLNALILAKCIAAHLWENSPYVSKQLKGIGPTFSTLLATAGKINFMLLEESHPRDLERIMNKGPPAGNVLRKQVSLLPKYQLTMTPIDEKSVTIQLVLLNQNYLSDNMEQLTAGGTHKSYVVVGDSENTLLLLTSFKDTDLMSVYDGTITHQITRKHSFEHKMFAHCISSSFVGIDAQCEYLFKDLDAVYPPPQLTTNAEVLRKQTNKQTTITDTFKERKRKNTSDNDITQSKEKKKRDSALFKKFKYLKESFGNTSKELKKDLDKSAVMSNKILQELTQLEKPTKCTGIVTEKLDKNITEPSKNIYYNGMSIQETNTEVIDNDEFMDDEKINSLLNEIESEISKGNLNADLPYVDTSAKNNTKNVQSSLIVESPSTDMPQRNYNLGVETYKTNNTKKRTLKNIKSNYNFIDLLEKNMNLSDEEEKSASNKNSGFSDTIKNQIEKYLQHSKTVSKVPEPDESITQLLQGNSNNESVRKHKDDLLFPTISSLSVLNDENSEYSVTANKVPNSLDVDLIETGQKDVVQSNPTNKSDEVTKKSKNHIASPIAVQITNNNNNKGEIYSTCGLEPSTNYDIIEKSLSIQNISLNENNYKNTDRNKNILTHDLISHNKVDSMVHVENNFNTQSNLNCHSFNEFMTECPSTNILALRNTQLQLLPHAERSKSQTKNICLKNNMNRIDLTEKASYSRSTPTIYSKPEQFNLLDSRYNNNNNTNASNHTVNIRRYSYSSTKIDAHVRVIRKIKMDLDITEIISRENEEINRMPEIEIDTNNVGKHNTGTDLKLPETINYGRKEIDTETKYDDIRYTVDRYVDLKFPERLNYFKRKEICIDTIADEKRNTVNKGIDFKVSEEMNYTEQLNTKYEENYNNVKNAHIDFEWPKRIINYAQDDEMKNAEIDFKISSVGNEVINKDNQGLFTENNNKKSSIRAKIATPSQFNVQCQHKEKNEYYSDTKIDDREKKISKEIPSKSNINPQTEGNRVKNILQKYSQILRKNSSRNLSQTLTPSKISDKDLINTPLEKPKRPFKITNIHNLSIPLPNTLISDTSKRENVAENNIEQKDETIYRQPQPQKENFHSSQPKEAWKEYTRKCALNVTHNENLPYNSDEELTRYELLLPGIANEELKPHQTEGDFNIDQSMLNPKTLLQCLSKDEPDIIVPPPAEFCDDSEIIPPKVEDNLLPMDCYEPMGCAIFFENDHINRCVSQDDSHIELTPQTEIETWTLSQNDESYQSYENLAASTSSFNPSQSFTLMHNSRQCNSPLQNFNVSLARQSKLGHFKFCHKSKYKPKV